MMRLIAWPAIVALVAVGCANPELKPAPRASTLTADGDIAVAETQDVRFRVDGGAWDGFPEELDEVVPVRVTINNESSKPVRIRFEDMALVGPQGVEFAALPPLQIEGTEEVQLGVGGAGVGPYAPGFYSDGFLLASPYAPLYTGVDPWVGPFAYDPLYYDTYYAEWPVELPTASMVEQALPEGVISPGGQVSGFVYFQDVPDDVERVTFSAQVVNAETGERMGSISIPFLTADA